MEIISILVCTPKSKIIMARQFKQINKMELENHVIEFTRNLYNSNKDPESTIVETDNARFIYIKFESLFLVAISSKNSNIIETTQVLRLVFSIMQEICKPGTFYNNY